MAPDAASSPAGGARRLWRGSARHLYATALRLGTPIYLLRQWQRAWTDPGYRTRLGERLGWYAKTAPVEPGVVWLHAPSLGEARSAGPLIQALREQQPETRMLLTHGTPTGRAAGAHLLRPGDMQAWLPYDTPGAVRRFLRHHRPAVGVLVEAELSPVLLHEARRAGVPMLLANARTKERAGARAAPPLAWLMPPPVDALQLVLAQSVADANRLREAGARRVVVCGDLGTDFTPPPRLLARGLAWRQSVSRPVVMLAGSRETEEASVLDAWLQRPAPRPLLVLVPRHRQRIDEVAQLVQARGLTMVRRSSWDDEPADRESANAADVWLGDSQGEMPAYYGCADVTLLGGSFAPLGGLNPVEAAACGCPVVMGPNTFRFAQAARLAERAGAALRVPEVAEAVAVAADLAASTRRNQMVQSALSFAQTHRGAARLMASHVLEVQQRLADRGH